MAALNRKLAERSKERKKREKAEAADRREQRLQRQDDDDSDEVVSRPNPAKRRRRKRKTPAPPSSRTSTPASMEAARQQTELELAYSPLMIAATRGDVASVKQMLKRGEDPAYVNASGQSILELVDNRPQAGFVKIRDILLAHLIPKKYHGPETGVSLRPLVPE